jgi:hypothetical protein
MVMDQDHFVAHMLRNVFITSMVEVIIRENLDTAGTTMVGITALLSKVGAAVIAKVKQALGIILTAVISCLVAIFGVRGMFTMCVTFRHAFGKLKRRAAIWMLFVAVAVRVACCCGRTGIWLGIGMSKMSIRSRGLTRRYVHVKLSIISKRRS